jgi:hypothetical protein
MEDRAIEPSPIANRIGIVAVVLLIAAFVLGTMWVFLAPAGADAQLTANRDDDAGDVVLVSDEDDGGGGSGDDGDNGNPTGNGNPTANGTGTGEPSIGTHSANTHTGTTAGTGISQTVSNTNDDRSANTHTGTTQGTGPSQTVSNTS